MSERTRGTLTLGTARTGSTIGNTTNAARTEMRQPPRFTSDAETMIQKACDGLDLDQETMSKAAAFARRLMS